MEETKQESFKWYRIPTLLFIPLPILLGAFTHSPVAYKVAAILSIIGFISCVKWFVNLNKRTHKLLLSPLVIWYFLPIALTIFGVLSRFLK